MNVHRILQNINYTGTVKDFDTQFITDDSRKVKE